jgi:hypothetical protein
MREMILLLAPLITAAGLGGVVGSYFTARFQQRNQLGHVEHELKQRRYLCMLILMLTRLNVPAHLEKLTDRRPDLRSPEDLDSELRTELLNAVVFASDRVLGSMAAFIRVPNAEHFLDAAAAMRADLWGRRMKVKPDILEAISQCVHPVPETTTKYAPADNVDPIAEPAVPRKPVGPSNIAVRSGIKLSSRE